MHYQDLRRQSQESYYQILEQPLSQSGFILINSECGIINGVKLKVDESLIYQDPFLVNYHYEKSYNKFKMRLYLTNYRILLQYDEIDPKYRSIPYGYIQTLQTNENCLILKNGMKLIITGLGNLMQLCTRIKQQVNKIPAKSSFKPKQIYDSLAQIQRMRIKWSKYLVVNNINGRICITYPHYIIIPSQISQSLLTIQSKNRNKGRIPVLAFHHQITQACIWRCARLKVGNSEAQIYSQAYLSFISLKHVVLDLRDKNTIKDSQTKCLQDFLFECLPQLRQSFQQLICAYTLEELPQSTSKIKRLTQQLGLKQAQNKFNPIRFSRCLSKWYQDTHKLLSCAFRLCQLLNNGSHTIIQELNAFDRAPQVISLASVILDPFYRTFRGLSVLIQKQFVSYGHPFPERLGFRRDKLDESSPIIVQFLECLHQLINVYPKYFEYSGAYLARIAYQIYTSKYCNFQQSQSNQMVGQSIWDCINISNSYYNYQWKEQQSIKVHTLNRNPSVKQYLIWKQYYDLVGLMQWKEQATTNNQIQLYNLIHNRTQF